MDKLAIVRSNRMAFLLVCAAALLFLFVSENSYRRAVKTMDELGTMGSARLNVHLLERGLMDAESGQRGYLMTGHQDYLVPYGQAIKLIEGVLQSLHQQLKDDPQGTQLMKRLQDLTDSKLSELALTVRLYDEGKTDAARNMILSGIGREQMVDTLALVDELLRQQSLQEEEGRDDVYRTLWMSRIGLALLSIIGVLALAMYLRQNSALSRQQSEQNGLVQAERDRLEQEVRRRTATLTQLTHHLQTAREDERHQLARDLHDELGALLTSAKLDVARVKSRLSETAPAAQELLSHLVDTLNSCVALKRRIVEGLHPSSLGHLGLVATLEILAREFAEQTGIEVHCELEPVALAPTAELVCYRVVQEAMTNITKYARARHVWITLVGADGEVHLSVRDDGVGFDITQQPASAHGLTGMRYRLEAEHGSLTVVAAPGQGTQIRATLPQAASAEG